MPAPHAVILSALRILANGDDRAPVKLANEWARALSEAGQETPAIVALTNTDDPVRARTLLGQTLARFGLADLTDIEKARLARAALARAYVEETISATDFATRLVRFLENAQDEVLGSDAFAREYRFVHEVDELFNYTLTQTAPHIRADLAARGIDHADPRSWVLRRMRALGIIDESNAPIDPRW
jgi:hypothetical protein